MDILESILGTQRAGTFAVSTPELHGNHYSTLLTRSALLPGFFLGGSSFLL